MLNGWVHFVRYIIHYTKCGMIEACGKIWCGMIEACGKIWCGMMEACGKIEACGMIETCGKIWCGKIWQEGRRGLI